MFNNLGLMVIGAIILYRGIVDENIELIYMGIITVNIGFSLFSIISKLNEMKGK